VKCTQQWVRLLVLCSLLRPAGLLVDHEYLGAVPSFFIKGGGMASQKEENGMKMTKKLKQFGVGISALLLFGVLCCIPLTVDAARGERKPPAVDAEQYANFMGKLAFGEQDLIAGAEIQRDFFNQITPPGVSLLQPMMPSVVPFDDADFSDSFLEGLLGEDKNSVAVYPLSIMLDPKTRKTLIYNVEGKLIISAFNPWGPRIELGKSDPSRVTLFLDLVPSEDVEQYLYTEARIFQSLAAIVRKPKRAGGMSQKSMGCGSNEFGIVAIQKLTNGNMQVTLTNGTGIAEMFAYTVEHTSTVSGSSIIWSLASPSYNGVDEPWVCKTTNLVLTNGVATWVDTSLPANARQRMYAVARRTDTDSDDLTDGTEFFVYHTNPGDDDTDGDILGDGWEVENGLNPLVNDGAQDADTDGLSNFLEYLNGTSPNIYDSDTNGVPDGWDTYSGTILKGDVDGSGILSSDDLTALDNILTQNSVHVPPVIFERADLNRDGVLNEIDRQGLQDLLDGHPQLYFLKPELN